MTLREGLYQGQAILMVFGVFVSFGEVVFLSKIDSSSVLGITDEKWENNLTIGESEGDSNQIKVKSEIAADDARPLIIRRYLEKYKSPLVPPSRISLIFSVCDI